MRVAGVEGQALEPADWGGGGGSLYTRDAILDPGDMPGLDNQCSVCPEKSQNLRDQHGQIIVAFFYAWMNGLVFFAFQPISSTHCKCALANIWRRRCSYLARSMFVCLSRPNPGADNENFRSIVSLLQGEIGSWTEVEARKPVQIRPDGKWMDWDPFPVTVTRPF